MTRLLAFGAPAFSHYDGVIESWDYPGDDRASARQRLARLGNRPQFILHEVSDQASTNLAATRAYLEMTGVDLKAVRFLETGFRNHNDAWILRPSPARAALRIWLDDVAAKPLEQEPRAKGAP